MKRKRRQVRAARRGFLRQRLAERIDAPHVGPIVTCDLRDEGVRRGKVRGGDLQRVRRRFLRDRPNWP